MLDYMRRNAQSIVIVFVLSILILAFIIEFGPQSQGCRSGDQVGQRSARSVMTVLG
ncbi:MAG: SurA N-terminal domain-containing protein, partial [Deltaproteobacteria bacterium]|nr:SurA N-terminal domain-containing protein [Deltaproteobacteria bacterium]